MLPVILPENVPIHDPAMGGHSNDFIPTQIFKDGNFRSRKSRKVPEGITNKIGCPIVTLTILFSQEIRLDSLRLGHMNALCVLQYHTIQNVRYQFLELYCAIAQ